MASYEFKVLLDGNETSVTMYASNGDHMVQLFFLFGRRNRSVSLNLNMLLEYDLVATCMDIFKCLDQVLKAHGPHLAKYANFHVDTQNAQTYDEIIAMLTCHLIIKAKIRSYFSKSEVVVFRK